MSVVVTDLIDVQEAIISTVDSLEWLAKVAGLRGDMNVDSICTGAGDKIEEQEEEIKTLKNRIADLENELEDKCRC